MVNFLKSFCIGLGAALIAFMVLITLVTAFFPAKADEHERYHHNFYEGLKRQGTNMSCCNDKDCAPLKEEPVLRGDFWHVKSPYGQVKVHRNHAQHMLTPDGKSHWCGVATGEIDGYGGSLDWQGTITTYCLIIVIKGF